MDGQLNESPQIVVAGRFLTAEEERRWRTALRDPVLLLLHAVLWILVGFFALQAVSLAAQSDWVTALVVLPLLAVCFWILIAVALRVRRKQQQAWEQRQWDHWQDERMIRGGCMISFYADHAAHTTMRGTNTVPYAAVTHFCETADGIAFGDRHYTIYLRSMDLTPGDMNALRRFLLQVLKTSLYRLKAPAMPVRHEPLPTVRFANFDTIVTRAAITDPREGRKQREMFCFLWPQLAVYSLIPALMTSLTPWPLLNVLIFAACAFGLGSAVALLVFRQTRSTRDTELALVFTEDGVAFRRDGVMDFVVRSRLKFFKGSEQLTLLFADGEQLEIPWDAVEDAAALRSKLELT